MNINVNELTARGINARINMNLLIYCFVNISDDGYANGF